MEFIPIIKEFGVAAVLVFLVCLGFIWLKQIASSLSSVSANLAKIKEEQAKKDKEQDEQIQYIKDNYAKKDDLYKEFGGWRAEITNLSNQINSSTQNTENKFMEIMKLLVHNNKESK